MSGFDLDYSQATDFTTPDDGTYEAVIGGLKEDATKSGAQFMNIDMVIRNDISDQKFKGHHIFRRIFVKKDTGKYPKGMLMSLAKASGLPDKFHFESFPEDYFAKLYHRPILITVKNEESEYKGKTYQNLNVKKWEVSKFPNVAHKFKFEDAKAGDPFASNGEAIDISDDDLPF